MKKILILLAAVIITATGAASSFAEVRMATEFSAVFIEKDGDTIEKGKIFYSGDMSRFERDGSGEVVVTRRDKKVIWIVFPKERKYVEQEYLAEQLQADQPGEKETGDLKRKFVGHEMVDSYRLKKYSITVKYSGAKGEDNYYEWYRDGFPFPVKTESASGISSFEYKQIKIGKQNPALFAEPKGYKKITPEEMPSADADKSKK